MPVESIEMNLNQRRIMIITSDENIVEQIRTNNNPSSYETFILEYDENDQVVRNKIVHFE